MTSNAHKIESYEYESAISEIKDNSRGGAIKNYMRLAVGSYSVLELFRYELIVGFFSGFPGGLGYILRRTFYPCILGGMGRNVIIGRNVTIRGPRKIFFGNNVVIEDNCSIDARTEKSRIFINDNVMIARGTIVRSRCGDIVVNEGTSIGSNSIIATDSGLLIGANVLISAYCYLSAGGSHNYDDPTVRIVDQGVRSKGGVVIEDGAWVGAQTVILDGARIGEGAIVGAQSMVNKKLPAMTISFGRPAKVVGKRGQR